MNKELMNAHPLWEENVEWWKFLINSYLGGKDYMDGDYLVGYMMESRLEYENRIDNTPIDNHVRAVVAIYNAFLFRKLPERKFGSLNNDPGLEAFLKDADLDGRSFDSIIRDVSTYSSVYGHVWVILDKPQSNAYTRAEELEQGLRPYISLYTPENVIDWNYTRAFNGVYVLDYLKVYEGKQKGRDFFRVYTPEEIMIVSYADETDKEAQIENVIPNQLGSVPAVCVYSQRSPHRGIGTSDVADVATVQKAIYCELSEAEQLIRLTNHPSLVKTASTQASAGAGAIVQIPEDLPEGLKPYLLQPSASSLDSLINSMNTKVTMIDRMAHMGGIRSIESRRLSGVALATEFQLLNARLAEKASNLEHAEEQVWRLYAKWQGTTWDGEINYPKSFNIQDRYNDMNMLKLAKDSAPRSTVLHEEIERQMLRLLVDDDATYNELAEEIDVEEINNEIQQAQLMNQPQQNEEDEDEDEDTSDTGFEPHIMMNPETGKQIVVQTERQHLKLQADGWVEIDD